MTTTILLTGAAGRLAQALLPTLCNTPTVRRIVGIDRRPCRFEHPKFTFVQADIRSDVLPQLMDNVNTLVHMAFQIVPDARGIDAMHDNNVGGTIKVLTAARQAGVFNVVYLSSTSVYGAGTEITEQAPLNPSPFFPYALHKAELDTLIALEHPHITTLRAHYIVGPNAYPFLQQLCRSRTYFTFAGPAPHWQVVHEQDVVTAICCAIERQPGGIYNLACPTAFRVDELSYAAARLQIPVPISLMRGLWHVWTRLSPKARRSWPNTTLKLINTTLTVNCDRAERQLGWRASRSLDSIVQELHSTSVGEST